MIRFGTGSRTFLKNMSEMPGPGSYKSSEKIGRESPKFTMNGRSNGSSPFKTLPGPGAYSPDKSVNDSSYTFSYPFLTYIDLAMSKEV